MATTYEPIATQTLGSNQTTVTFSSIPATYTDLVLITSVKDTNGVAVLRVNNDSSAIYSRTWVFGNGSSAGSNRSTGLTNWYVDASSSNFIPSISNFMNYSNSTTNKTVLQRYGNAASGTTAAAYLWSSTAAINRIDIISISGTATLETGSTFTLYGIKAA